MRARSPTMVARRNSPGKARKATGGTQSWRLPSTVRSARDARIARRVLVGVAHSSDPMARGLSHCLDAGGARRMRAQDRYRRHLERRTLRVLEAGRLQ